MDFELLVETCDTYDLYMIPVRLFLHCFGKVRVLLPSWCRTELVKTQRSHAADHVHVHVCGTGLKSNREPSSCMRLGSNKSYHPTKKFRILCDNSHKSKCQSNINK